MDRTPGIIESLHGVLVDEICRPGSWNRLLYVLNLGHNFAHIDIIVQEVHGS